MHTMRLFSKLLAALLATQVVAVAATDAGAADTTAPAASPAANPPAAAPVFPAGVSNADPATIEARLGHGGVTLLDVRTAEEFHAGHVPGAINIPVQELQGRLGELSPLREQALVVYCHSGRRAAQALQLLAQQGYPKLEHLAGDMMGWQAAGRPVEGAAPAAQKK